MVQSIKRINLVLSRVFQCLALPTVIGSAIAVGDWNKKALGMEWLHGYKVLNPQGDNMWVATYSGSCKTIP